MYRKQFLSLLTVGTAATAISASLVSCAQNNSLAPTNVDFTIDLNNSTYAPLKTNGGSIYKGGVIVARSNSGAFLAFSQYCTHAGCTVNFNGVNAFDCYCHGSVFDSNGNPVQGPASSALNRYKTQLSGTMLHVYS
jgi:cytochrome b6-f complex iron-sulfur subunit